MVTGSGGSGQVASDSKPTSSPSSRARLTRAIAPSTGQPRVSSPGSPVASVAVVMIAWAPSTSATLMHSALAPAACPPTSVTAYRPGSSTQTTAGSTHLLSSNGATSRVVAPTARKHTSSVALGPGPVQRLPGWPVVAAGLAGPRLGQPGGGGTAGHGDRDEPDHRGAPGLVSRVPGPPRSARSAGSVAPGSAPHTRNTGLVAASRCTSPGSGANLAACTSAPSVA